MRKRLIVVLVLVIAVGVAVAACQSGESAVPQAGKPALDFELPDLSGQTVSLSGLRGQPVMVNFWATWCGPCVHEMPFLQAVHEGWSARGLVILAVNVGDSPAQVQQFIDGNGYTFPVLLDAEGEAAERYRVRGIPTTIFIDKEGIIKEMKVGSFPSPEAIEASLSRFVP